MLSPFSGQHISSYFYTTHKADEVSSMHVTKSCVAQSRLSLGFSSTATQGTMHFVFQSFLLESKMDIYKMREL